MKAEIEDLPLENRGIDVTSENDAEKEFLESLWSRSPAAVMFSRHANGSVTITIGPARGDKD